MAKILIVDDEMHIRDLVRKYAVYEGYETTEATDGLDAINKIKTSDFDLVVMDIMMPNLDGFSAVKEIRKFSKVPVILLSARSEEYDKIYGFDLGVDDYVTKPFSPKELMLRIKAILKRVENQKEEKAREAKMLTFLNLKMDLDAHLVYINDERVDLTLKEYELLLRLVQNKDNALTREYLLKEIWGTDFDGDDRTLDTHIKSLRKKIGLYADYIITIRGVGYRFESKTN